MIQLFLEISLFLKKIHIKLFFNVDDDAVFQVGAILFVNISFHKKDSLMLSNCFYNYPFSEKDSSLEQKTEEIIYSLRSDGKCLYRAAVCQIQTQPTAG